MPILSISQDLILDGNNIPLDSNSTVTIDPVTGNVSVTSLAGDLTCSSSSTAPVLSLLTANPTTVVSGGSSTISWTLSGQATSCTKSGDWTGTLTGADVTDGSHNEIVTNITTNSSFSLQCSNAVGNSAFLTANVSVTGSANCLAQPPILAGNEDTTIIGNGTANSGSYDGTYKGFQNNGGTGPDWPGNYGDSISLSLTNSSYISASFTTNNLNERGRFQLATTGNTQGPPASGAISISECPGDFATHLGLARCQKLVGVAGSFKWATDPTADPNTYCILEKNTPYYFNFVHSITPETYTPSTCGSTYCGILATQVEETP